jgi:hypothetical protein
MSGINKSLVTVARNLQRVKPIIINNKKQIPYVVSLFQMQQRGLQVRKRAEGSLHQGWFDSLSGMYEDPRYPLDMKPAEFRNGQFYYLFEYLGIVIVLLPCILAAFMAAFSLAWYTFVDSQVTYVLCYYFILMIKVF